MKPKKLIIYIVSGVLLAITITGIFLIKNNQGAASDSTNSNMILPHIAYYTVQKRSLSEDISAYGSVNYFKKVNVTSRVEEVVSSIYYDIGDTVFRGKTLAQLDNEYIQLSYDVAQTEVNSKEAAFNLSRSKYENAVMSVEKTLKSLENLEIEEQQKRLELVNISHVLSNKRELLTFGGVTKEQIRELENNYQITELKYQGILKQKAAAEIGFRNSDIINAGYKVPASEVKRIELLKRINTKIERAEMEIAQSEWDKSKIQLRSAKMNLGETIIKSPIDGIVAMKYLERGEKVEKSKPLFTIMQLDKVYIELPVPETQIANIKTGQSIKLKIDAHPLINFNGEVERVYPMIDTKTRTFTVRCIINNRKVNAKEYMLLPGMFVRANIITSVKKDILTVPFTAMSDKETKQIKVFILKPVKEEKNVALAVEKWVPFSHLSDDYIEIVNGLKEGDIVALSGLDYLKTGMRVQLKDQELKVLEDESATNK